MKNNRGRCLISTSGLPTQEQTHPHMHICKTHTNIVDWLEMTNDQDSSGTSDHTISNYTGQTETQYWDILIWYELWDFPIIIFIILFFSAVTIEVSETDIRTIVHQANVSLTEMQILCLLIISLARVFCWDFSEVEKEKLNISHFLWRM